MGAPMKRLALFLSFGLLGLGCERVDYIELSPSSVVFKQSNNTAWMEAKCMARTNVRAVKSVVTWSVADPTIATVDHKGVLKPLKAGHTEVVARFGEVMAAVPVDVIYVEKVTVDPTVLTLTEGTPAVAVGVKAFDGKGKLLTDRTPTLHSNNTKVAQIVGKGSVLALDPGEAVVDVQVDDVKTSIQVKVLADAKAKK
jgi:hypothetical protein